MTNHRQKVYWISKTILKKGHLFRKKYYKLTYFGISITDSDIRMTNCNICLYVKYIRKSLFLSYFKNILLFKEYLMQARKEL